MAKKLFCVTKGGKVVPGPTGTKYWAKKASAKKARNQLHVEQFGELPDRPDDRMRWLWVVSPGPDHWRYR